VEEKKSEMKKTREELGARETVVEKIKKRRLLWFGHVEPNEERKTTNRSFTWTRGGKEKQRERKENLDGQCPGRPEHEKHRLGQDW